MNDQKIINKILFDLIKQYDFKKNSIKSFCRINNINSITVKKYLDYYKIDYNKRSWNPSKNLQRDSNGCFLSGLNIQLTENNFNTKVIENKINIDKKKNKMYNYKNIAIEMCNIIKSPL